MTCSARLAALTVAALSTGLAAVSAKAHDIEAEAGNAKLAFDIVRADVTADENWLTFRMSVAGTAGERRPEPVGDLAGAPVYSYVWPTRLDTAQVGFGKDKGLLAFAVTSHPDFDDTPLFDENGDGNRDNDGRAWHSHWVVLVPADEACGGGLKVKDIPEDAEPELPATWPGLPLFIDSPGYDPKFSGDTVTVRVPFRDAPELAGVAFDAVTSGLRVNQQVHAPLLCVDAVFDVASGDLSLPGQVE